MSRGSGSIIAAGVILSVLGLAELPRAAQTPAARPQSNAPRTADGKPNFNGLWQVLSTANWNIQDHSGDLGVPPGRGRGERQSPPTPAGGAGEKEEKLRRARDRRSHGIGVLSARRSPRDLHALPFRNCSDAGLHRDSLRV